MRALMSIEGFRNLNSDIETIINKSEAVKKAKKEKESFTPKEKKQLSEEEKEFKSKRKEIQEKLIKFATRIPVFMYLTDYREQCLKDVITQFEPGLFKKVTGLEVRDFELLVSLGVFNDAVMNDAVYKFRRYEDASLSYTGIERHSYDASVGLFDTALSREDYEEMKRRDSRAEPEVAAPLGEEPTIVAEEAGPKPTAEASVTPSVAAPARPSRQPLDSIEVGDVVRHKAFGEGTVVSLDEGRIVVHLGGKDRMFAFPGAFEQGFLRL